MTYVSKEGAHVAHVVFLWCCVAHKPTKGNIIRGEKGAAVHQQQQCHYELHYMQQSALAACVRKDDESEFRVVFIFRTCSSFVSFCSTLCTPGSGRNTSGLSDRGRSAGSGASEVVQAPGRQRCILLPHLPNGRRAHY